MDLTTLDSVQDQLEPPLVSVVTVVYNRVELIGETMASVQEQTYPNVEHIIQDGGSTDGTLCVLERVKTEKTKIDCSPDGGIYDAINKGIARSSGDIIGLLHSDDTFCNNTILADVIPLFDDPTVDGVYGDLDYVASNDSVRVVRRWRSGPYTRDRLSSGWMPPHPTLYLRRSVFETWGTYDTSFRIAADYDAMLRYLAQGQISLSYLPIVMIKMRLGGESNRSLSQIIQKSREDYRAIRHNNVGGFRTLALKNLSKIGQFF